MRSSLKHHHHSDSGWTALVLVCLLGTSATASGMDENRLDPGLKSILAFREGRLPANLRSAPPEAFRDEVGVYLIFKRAPDAQRLDALEASGVRFVHRERSDRARARGRSRSIGRAHIGRIYPARVPWRLLSTLSSADDLDRIEAIQPRKRVPAMDVSLPEVEADRLALIPRAEARGLSGRGLQVAAFDTSVDLYHPALFKPDGGLYSWLDLDGDGVFTPGLDAVDLNGDGAWQEGETLRLLENAFFDVQYGPQLDGYLDADHDWLYADTNENGERDYGLDKGYDDDSPAYGEPLFVVEDINADLDLNPGERLIRLGTSKVLAALDGDGEPLFLSRGEDLLELTPDPYPHGTSVAGILLGDIPGRRYTGIAPEAELLEVNTEGAGVDMITAMEWARDEGADVFVYEFGEWSGEFLDGSSALEEAVAALAGDGIPQVCPSGNIGDNNKHGMMSVAPDSSEVGIFVVDDSFQVQSAFLTALWRAQNPVLSFTLEFVSDDGIGVNEAIEVEEGQTASNAEGDSVYGETSISDRGTNMMDMVLYHEEDGIPMNLTGGLYYLTVTNTGTTTATVHLYLADDRSTWSGGVTWLSTSDQSVGDISDPTYSVASPATADDCLVVGSYATRQSDILFDLSTFSSRGPRIDQADLLDITAPGNFDIISPTSSAAVYYDASINAYPNYPLGSSWYFGGTSASAPHVAAGLLLLLELNPALTHSDLEAAIREGALEDEFTGSVPNESWGMGKLRLEASLQEVDDEGPSFDIFVDRHPILSRYVMATIVPTERLSAPPSIGVSGGDALGTEEAGADVYTLLIEAETGTSLTITATGTDLQGNSGSKTVVVSAP